MIGQTKLISAIDLMVENKKLPRFIILEGLPGSGRKTLAQYIAKKLDAGYMQYTCGVDDMRTMIANANKITSPYVFVIPDADNMSPAAKNCILKVTEEPPQNIYFVMTVSDVMVVLPTIISRGAVIHMEKYTPADIKEYVTVNKIAKDEEDMGIYTTSCECPGDVLLMASYNPKEFSGYVKKVSDNLDKVSIANMYKIAEKIKLKETQDGYDLRLFWRVFVNHSADLLREDVVKYGKWVTLTCKKLQELQITGANKQILFSSWLTDLKVIEHGRNNS